MITNEKHAYHCEKISHELRPFVSEQVPGKVECNNQVFADHVDNVCKGLLSFRNFPRYSYNVPSI